MNIIMSVQRVHLVKNGEKKAYRRILSVNEIVDSEKNVNPFKWDPIKDEQAVDLDSSFLLTNFSERLGITREQLIEEIASYEQKYCVGCAKATYEATKK